MTISLVKGGNISLTKTDPTLNHVMVGLSWDARETDGIGYDLDASAFMLSNGRVVTDNGFIFYNNLVSACGSIEHAGDNLTGDGDGDDETISLQLDKIPSEIDCVVFIVTIHCGLERKQNFGQVTNACIRLVNVNTDTEILRYDLTEDASTGTSMLFGQVYRLNGEWKFKAIGNECKGDLGNIAASYGVNV